MFTGIVEELGVVQSVENKKNLTVLNVKAGKILKGIKKGDSVAVNGVCLTVTQLKGKVLTFDIMKETIRATGLKTLKKKEPVNLERALKVKSRFDGHFVTGHVDGLGELQKIVSEDNYVKFYIKVPRRLLKYIVPKGSVCIEGVSLTVGEVKAGIFSVYLIPYTLKVTTLGCRRKNDKLNIETDILAKYILN